MQEETQEDFPKRIMYTMVHNCVTFFTNTHHDIPIPCEHVKMEKIKEPNSISKFHTFCCKTINYSCLKFTSLVSVFSQEHNGTPHVRLWPSFLRSWKKCNLLRYHTLYFIELIMQTSCDCLVVRDVHCYLTKLYFSSFAMVIQYQLWRASKKKNQMFSQ